MKLPLQAISVRTMKELLMAIHDDDAVIPVIVGDKNYLGVLHQRDATPRKWESLGVINLTTGQLEIIDEPARQVYDAVDVKIIR